MIDNKFLYFKTLQGFEDAKVDRFDGRSGIREDSIVFIGKEKLIWNRGVFYGGTSEEDQKNKGLFESELMLKQSVRSPKQGDWAVVKSGSVWYIYSCKRDGVWTNTGNQYHMGTDSNQIQQLINQYSQQYTSQIRQMQYNISNVDTKYQNITNRIQSFIDGLPEVRPVDSELSTSSENPVQNSVIATELSKKLDQADLEDYAKVTQVRSLINDRVLEIIQAIEQSEGTYNIKEEIINERIEELNALVNEINQKYISWGINESSSGEDPEPSINNFAHKMVTLSDTEYQELVSTGGVDNNTYYFVYSSEDYPETWTFGNKFPITFTEQWAFGGTFPITLN